MKQLKRPSPNYFTGGVRVEAIVLHGTAGPLLPSIQWLQNPRPDNPGAAVSANYVISKAGLIYELVDWRSGLRAWANGRLRNPDPALTWLARAVRERINPNMLTISIEHEASNSEMLSRASMTDAQFNASTELVITLLREIDKPISNQTVTGHYQFDSIGKANCPGVINIPAYIEVLQLRKDWYK